MNCYLFFCYTSTEAVASHGRSYFVISYILCSFRCLIVIALFYWFSASPCFDWRFCIYIYICSYLYLFFYWYSFCSDFCSNISSSLTVVFFSISHSNGGGTRFGIYFWTIIYRSFSLVGRRCGRFQPVVHNYFRLTPYFYSSYSALHHCYLLLLVPHSLLLLLTVALFYYFDSFPT